MPFTPFEKTIDRRIAIRWRKGICGCAIGSGLEQCEGAIGTREVQSVQVTAGYSKRSLAEKIGIRPGFRISLENEPADYHAVLGDLPAGVEFVSRRAAELDLVHLFATSRRQLAARFPKARKRIKPDGMLWVSWPKQTSPLRGDLNENVVREIGLANGLVDVKVAAIDADWSGLKFVFRLQDRSR